MSELNGILVVDKPSDWTSHDVVKKTKNMLGGVKVGHTGTLDPFATGVLVLLIGKATKHSRLFEKDDKRYDAEITFGCATDTYDRTGEITETGEPDTVEMNILSFEIRRFYGRIEQIPPMYSALKINGTRLYKLARQGKHVDLKPRMVTISEIEADISRYPIIDLSILCSKGTYVRSIADQLGKNVGCPAHLSALRRTAAGRFTLEDAVNFQSVCDTADTDILRRSVRHVVELEIS